MVMVIAILEVYGNTNVCSGEFPLLPLDRMSTLRCSRVTCILTLTTILQSGQHSLEAPQRGGCCEAGQCLPWLKLVDWDDAWSYYCSRGRSIHRRWLRRHPHCQLTLKFSSTLLTVLAVAGVATLLVSESFQPSLDSNVLTLPFHFQKPDAPLWRLPASTKAPKCTPTPTTDTSKVLSQVQRLFRLCSRCTASQQMDGHKPVPPKSPAIAPTVRQPGSRSQPDVKATATSDCETCQFIQPVLWTASTKITAFRNTVPRDYAFESTPVVDTSITCSEDHPSCPIPEAPTAAHQAGTAWESTALLPYHSFVSSPPFAAVDELDCKGGGVTMLERRLTPLHQDYLQALSGPSACDTWSCCLPSIREVPHTGWC